MNGPEARENVSERGGKPGKKEVFYGRKSGKKCFTGESPGRYEKEQLPEAISAEGRGEQSMSRAAVRTVRRAAAVRTNRSSMDAYTYGTAAREVAPSYEEAQRRERRLEQRRRVRTAKRRQQEAARMDLPYLMMFIVATVAALLICCSYIRVQSEIAGSIHQISALEQELERMRSENNALETRINTSIDLDHIYDVAVSELGMVSANRGQIIRYKNTESEYVRQYEDIPGQAPRGKARR